MAARRCANATRGFGVNPRERFCAHPMPGFGMNPRDCFERIIYVGLGLSGRVVRGGCARGEARNLEEFELPHAQRVPPAHLLLRHLGFRL